MSRKKNEEMCEDGGVPVSATGGDNTASSILGWSSALRGEATTTPEHIFLRFAFLLHYALTHQPPPAPWQRPD